LKPLEKSHIEKGMLLCLLPRWYESVENGFSITTVPENSCFYQDLL